MNTELCTDERYMRRCLQLAGCGRQESRPNPMVGAVIVAHDRIIGEGYHVRCGEGHAEVNAFASVCADDEQLLPQATVYVSLEPCAHYGKTPPCAELIIRKGVRRVVVGCQDTFSKVSGRGIQMLREAGIDVTVGVLEEECRWQNRRFFTFHEKQRPYIILKWAQTADGYLDDNFQKTAISSEFSRILVHKMRAEEDAILVGRITAERDRPQLDVRHWSGRNPKRFVLTNAPEVSAHATPLATEKQAIDACREMNLQSLIVEGGAHTLQSFIDARLWDEIRIETNPTLRVGSGTKAPTLPDNIKKRCRQTIDGNEIVNLQALD